jgi:hypothetical protein
MLAGVRGSCACFGFFCSSAFCFVYLSDVSVVFGSLSLLFVLAYHGVSSLRPCGFYLVGERSLCKCVPDRASTMNVKCQ